MKLGPHELNTVVQGDCLELMKALPDKCVDLVLTDPPYGLDFPYESYVDTKENLIQLISLSMPEIIRVSHRVAITCGITQMHLYPKPNWIAACVWDTTGSYGMLGYTQWFPVLFYGKDVSGIGSINGQLKSDVMRVTGGASVGFMRDGKNGNHPCPKPINLIKKIINRLSIETNIILDPFAGSGTTLVAAKQLGRQFLGFELEEKYCAIARERLKQEVLSL